MSKTPEELADYIRDYKSKLLEEVNADTQRLFDLGNNADLKVGTQLLTLGAALFAVLGSFVVGGDPVENDGVKVISALAVTLLLVSLGAGIKNLNDISSFWTAAGVRKHKEGRIIIDDNAKTYDNLVDFRNRLERYRGEGVEKGPDAARLTQIISFFSSVCLMFILIIAKIFF